jgi:hypothetical protein
MTGQIFCEVRHGAKLAGPARDGKRRWTQKMTAEFSLTGQKNNYKVKKKSSDLSNFQHARRSLRHMIAERSACKSAGMMSS